MAVGSAYWRDAEKSLLQEKCERGWNVIAVVPISTNQEMAVGRSPVLAGTHFSSWPKIEKDESSPTCNLQPVNCSFFRFPFSVAPRMPSMHASLCRCC
jgi:hypothetical protein